MIEQTHILGPHVMREAGNLIALAEDGHMMHGYVFNRAQGDYGKDEPITELERNTARLYVAAFNAFDSAARILDVSAVELAERLAGGTIADLIGMLTDARQWAKTGKIRTLDFDQKAIASRLDHTLAKVGR